MTCQQCHEPLEVGDEFCSQCGEPVEGAPRPASGTRNGTNPQSKPCGVAKAWAVAELLEAVLLILVFIGAFAFFLILS